jgi:ribosomal protein S17
MYQRHSQLQKNNDAIIKGIKGTHSCRKTTALSSKVSKALVAAEKQRRYHQKYQRHSQLQKNNDAIIKGTHSCRKTTTLSSKVSKALTAAEKQRRYHQRYQRHSQLQKNNDAIVKEGTVTKRKEQSFYQSADRSISLINNLVKEKVYKK